MRIYFYDGPLDDNRYLNDCTPKAPEFLRDLYGYNALCVNAQYGPSANIYSLKWAYKRGVSSILTNSLLALDHRFAWNKEECHTDIYLWVPSARKYIRIDKLTGREIRQGHNIANLYLAGEFEYKEKLYE